MNLLNPLIRPLRSLYRFGIKCKRLLPRERSCTFGSVNSDDTPKIEQIYVINLNRQPDRWNELKKELGHVLDSSGSSLENLTVRYPAVDARLFNHKSLQATEVDVFYTLQDQLFVEPQPRVFPDQVELDRPIQMSRQEIAIALSHIGIWQQIAADKHSHTLILEDDVFFNFGFAQHLDHAWNEIQHEEKNKYHFDILYLSYQEVRNGAQKSFLSHNVFCPTRGLWNLSGYVLSRKGARKLLHLLPCRGPIDLWINHQFESLDVRATRRSVISQRRDGSSTNLYSILPTLTKIGAITCEGASLFHIRPTERPVFAFGPKGSGLSSLAMALSMLGYRCCSDLQDLPQSELEMLLAGAGDRVFDAYVNIGVLAEVAQTLIECYPTAKFIITTGKVGVEDENKLGVLDHLTGADVVTLQLEASNKWQVICEHLRCAPPVCSFPELADLGQRKLLDKTSKTDATKSNKTPKRDKSPWVVESRHWWKGIHSAPAEDGSVITTPLRLSDSLQSLDMQRWLLRNDTFTDNLAMFRPSNIEFCSERGTSLSIRKEALGVREYSAAALTSRGKYLFGKFEATIKASNVPGVVTGIFLHRDSPRQEIDIEITGNRTDRLIANVFYNPGSEGAKFDYGYRGAASYINLGFDASTAYHSYAIEWNPCEICWYVDSRLVHRRVAWDPTPIPHLPMAFHVNTWLSRSKELAGQLVPRQLPANTFIRSIELEANQHENLSL